MSYGSLDGRGVWGRMDTCICKAGSLCCPPETITTVNWLSVQLSSVAQSCPTLCDHVDCSTPGLPVHHQLLELAQTQVHWASDAIQSSHLICHPLLCPPSIFPSIRVFSNELVLCVRWPKDWSFSFSINPSNEYSELIFFRMDWLDLIAVQGTRKSLLQHHSSKASILRYSAFFIVQLSHPYMTTGKTITLTRQTFVGKVMSLLFSMLSRFLGRSHRLQWFWSPQKESLSLLPLFPHLFAMRWWDWMPWS